MSSQLLLVSEYLKFEALQFDMCDVLAATQFLSSNTLSRGGQILPGELYKVTLKSISGDKQVYMIRRAENLPTLSSFPSLVRLPRETLLEMGSNWW